MIETILEPFQYDFMIRAFIVSIGIGILCPMVGSYVVVRRLAFMGDALSHTALPGLVLGYLIGLNPLILAIPACILTAFTIGFLRTRTGLSEDTSIGIVLAGLFALGLAMISMAGGVGMDLRGVLLGQILGVTNQDLWIIFGICIGTCLILYLFHKELVFNSFDPQGASIIGLPSSWLDYLLLVLISLVVVASVQAVGVVLMLAMLITPAAIAKLLAKNFVSMMFVGSLIGVIICISGVYTSYFLNLPSGPAMTLIAVSVFMIVALATRRVTA